MSVEGVGSQEVVYTIPKSFDEAAANLGARVANLIISKQRDYGKNNLLKFGDMGILVRLSDKMERLINLITKNKNPSVKSESVDDTLYDVIGYCFAWLLIRRQEFQLPLEGENEK